MSTFTHSDFNSSAYSAYRPTYDPSLYEKVYSFHKSHNGQFDTALDIGTGTGQVASELSNSFKQVYATDPSSTMLQNATKKSNITYSVSFAEDLSQFSSNSIDLITVAEAAHWFNMAEFYKESFRILKPHGTLAIWGYGYNSIRELPPNYRQLMKRFITDDDKLGPYWDKGLEILQNLYRDFKIPEDKFQNVKWEFYDDENLDTEPLLKVEWTISQLTKYIKTWSAYKNYLAANPNAPDPVDNHISELKQLTGWKDNEVSQVYWESVLILAERTSL